MIRDFKINSSQQPVVINCQDQMAHFMERILPATAVVYLVILHDNGLVVQFVPSVLLWAFVQITVVA